MTPNQDKPKGDDRDLVERPKLDASVAGRFNFGDYDKPIKLFLLGLAIVAALSFLFVGMQHLVFWQFVLMSMLPIVLYLFAVMFVVMMWEPTPRGKKAPGSPKDEGRR